jgi:hypothetical protein
VIRLVKRKVSWTLDYSKVEKLENGTFTAGKIKKKLEFLFQKETRGTSL